MPNRARRARQMGSPTPQEVAQSHPGRSKTNPGLAQLMMPNIRQIMESFHPANRIMDAMNNTNTVPPQQGTARLQWNPQQQPQQPSMMGVDRGQILDAWLQRQQGNVPPLGQQTPGAATPSVPQIMNSFTPGARIADSFNGTNTAPSIQQNPYLPQLMAAAPGMQQGRPVSQSPVSAPQPAPMMPQQAQGGSTIRDLMSSKYGRGGRRY